MPMVQVTMLQGRTADQKRKIAKRITDALVEEAGARREGDRRGLQRGLERKLCFGRRVDDRQGEVDSRGGCQPR